MAKEEKNMKKIAVLLLVGMTSLAIIPTVPAAAQPRGDQFLAAASAKGKGQGNTKKTSNAQKAKKAPKDKNDAKARDAKNKNDNVDANQRPDRKGKFSDRAPTWKNDVIVSTNLSAVEIRPVAVSYGLVNYKPLPPGIRKNLMRGKPLPPGIAKKMVPNVLLVDLPYYSGYEWRVAGSDLILIAISTNAVIDILSDIFD